MAASQGHRDAVQLLINHGADVTIVNKVRVHLFIYLFIYELKKSPKFLGG